MADQLLVSVVIPTKDRNHEVTRAVAGALAQTVREIEVIVVDDGSVEPARAVILATFDDPRLVFHRNDTPTGPSSARNVGTALARGAFVAFLDSDDEWHPTKLARQIDALVAQRPRRAQPVRLRGRRLPPARAEGSAAACPPATRSISSTLATSRP